jgi:hypothetical protein
VSLRRDLAEAERALDDLLWVASDATGPAPIVPREAQRADVDRHGAEIRALLRVATARLDAMHTGSVEEITRLARVVKG